MESNSLQNVSPFLWRIASSSALYLIAKILIRLVGGTNNKLNNNTKRTKPSRTLAVLGSGGHTTEMIRLLSSLSKEHYMPLYYIVASTDTTSINRLNSIHESENKQFLPPRHSEVYTIPRAREVGQSYVTSIFTTILSIVSSAHIVLLKVQPDILIINGPGTCMPIAFWTFVGRMLGICEGKIIFCESFCRVNSLSLTGKLLLKFRMVDLFLVHWQELMNTMKKNYADTEHVKFVLLDSFITHDDDSNQVL
mmetsp:Transcript_25656/g.32329  ORF Transcript_25656/g.32329 Transcript_25656/m.32329 type:complete len:251 (+) Transcript_25656:65-817(+)